MRAEPWQIDSLLLALHNIASGVGTVTATLFLSAILRTFFNK